MSLIPDLPMLPSLNFPTASTNPIVTGSTVIGDTAGKVKDAIVDPVGTVTSAFLSSKNVIILLGLLLIAAGLFTFDKTKELVVSTAKAGVKAGSAALAA